MTMLVNKWHFVHGQACTTQTRRLTRIDSLSRLLTGRFTACIDMEIQRCSDCHNVWHVHARSFQVPKDSAHCEPGCRQSCVLHRTLDQVQNQVINEGVHLRVVQHGFKAGCKYTITSTASTTDTQLIKYLKL
jgi:hypothetical protein